MAILVFGASSQLGHFLLPALLHAGEEVIAISRTPRASAGRLQWRLGGLPADIPALDGVDGIISYGPLDALVDWLGTLPRAPAGKLVAISSMSIVSKQASEIAAERVLVARLGRGEQGVEEQCNRLGMRWSILRPTLIYGAGLDRSLTRVAANARKWRIFPLPSGRGLRQPVHAADVAEASWRALRSPTADGRVIPIGGGERLPASEMFSRVRDSLGVATCPFPLHKRLLDVIAAILPPARGPISRLQVDLVADNALAHQLLNIHPRAFSVNADMWMPAAMEGRR